MHVVQAFILLGLPSIMALTLCRFGLKTCFVLLSEWLILLPTVGPLPHISHFQDIIVSLLEFRNECNIYSISQGKSSWNHTGGKFVYIADHELWGRQVSTGTEVAPWEHAEVPPAS